MVANGDFGEDGRDQEQQDGSGRHRRRRRLRHDGRDVPRRRQGRQSARRPRHRGQVHRRQLRRLTVSTGKRWKSAARRATIEIDYKP
ncbi:MAG: hypothetical protein MZU97_09650 [Bacillus subtilis]|nr:hypothetical protein [Bacillus subtilis]